MTVALIVLSLPITIIGANFDDEYQAMRARRAKAREMRMQLAEAKIGSCGMASSKNLNYSSMGALRFVSKVAP